MSDGDLQSLGQTLRQAREALALTLDEVETQTRIRAKYIQALESGDLSVLPSVTHAKGFLRNYAQFLHLDANALVATFGEITGAGTASVTTLTAAPTPYREPGAPYADPSDPSAPVILPSSPPPVGEAARPTYVTPATRVGPAVPRGLGGTMPSITAAMYSPAQAEAEPRQTRSLPVRLIQSNVFVAAILLIGFVVIVWWASTQLSQVSVEDFVPTQGPSVFVEQFSGSATFEAGPTFRPTSSPEADSGPGQVQFDRVILSISVQQRAWTRVTVDGEVQFEGQAEPGTVQQYEAQESISIYTGNAAGLVVTYNGQEIGPLGERGEVLTEFFTVTGQMTPTATPTQTVTPTDVPSPTPRVTPTADRDG